MLCAESRLQGKAKEMYALPCKRAAQKGFREAVRAALLGPSASEAGAPVEVSAVLQPTEVEEAIAAERARLGQLRVVGRRHAVSFS